MHVTTGQVIGTALATGTVGFVVWLATVPLRWRSVAGLLVSVVLTGPLAALGGIGWALLLASDRVAGPRAALLLALVAAVVAALESGVGAIRAHRRYARAHRQVQAALGCVAGGTVPADATRPLLSDLETVRAGLSEVARSVAAERGRRRALDESRRGLIAWVSQDLHAPLTVLRAMSEVPAAGAPPEVRSEIARLVEVVDDLFDLATAPPDGEARSLVVPRSEPTLLADVLARTVTALEPLARLRGVAVRVRGATTVQVRLVDPAGEDLGRRLLALMVDAIRVSPSGSTMTVEVVPDAADHGAVRVDLLPGDAAGPAPVALLDLVPPAGLAPAPARGLRLPLSLPA